LFVGEADGSSVARIIVGACVIGAGVGYTVGFDAAGCLNGCDDGGSAAAAGTAPTVDLHCGVARRPSSNIDRCSIAPPVNNNTILAKGPSLAVNGAVFC
jgi:hypothetical protein